MKKASCAVSRRRARRARNQRTADWLCRVFECARRSVRQRWRWCVGVCGRSKARVCVRLCRFNSRFAKLLEAAHTPGPGPGQPRGRSRRCQLVPGNRRRSTLTVLKPYHQTISSHRFTSSRLTPHPSSPSPPYHSPHLTGNPRKMFWRQFAACVRS